MMISHILDILHFPTCTILSKMNLLTNFFLLCSFVEVLGTNLCSESISKKKKKEKRKKKEKNFNFL